VSRVRPNLPEFFVALDKKFSTELTGSALDVDIFANCVDNVEELEHLEELLYKLRRTPHTVHSPESTNHATIRAFVRYGGEEHLKHLLKMLDDRTNYGLFLDSYTAILLLDQLLDRRQLVAGARIASHLMLQEDEEPIANSMGNLACWKYLAEGRTEDWYDETEVTKDESDEVIRVRVKGMVPNNYHDDHFDLREPDKILGKTLCYLNGNLDDPVNYSLNMLGLSLRGNFDAIPSLKKGTLISGVAELISAAVTDENALKFINSLEIIEADVETLLSEECKTQIGKMESDIINQQLKLYEKWIDDRVEGLHSEKEKLNRRTKLEDLSRVKENLSREEQRLFFFDNLDRMDREKEDKDRAWRRTFPRRDWNRPGYFSRPKYVSQPGQELKEARWQKREQKRGPPK